MSVRMGIAKLGAIVAAGALIGGGAVHMAEKQKPGTPQYIKHARPAHHIAAVHRKIPPRAVCANAVITRTHVHGKLRIITSCPPLEEHLAVAQPTPTPTPDVIPPYVAPVETPTPAPVEEHVVVEHQAFNGFFSGFGGFGGFGGFFGGPVIITPSGSSATSTASSTSTSTSTASSTSGASTSGASTTGGATTTTTTGSSGATSTSTSTSSSTSGASTTGSTSGATTSGATTSGATTSGATTSGATTSGATSSTAGGTAVPAPPMMVLFGASAAAIANRRRLARDKGQAAA